MRFRNYLMALLYVRLRKQSTKHFVNFINIYL
nr:MAG TPA: hypothetical protein [Caudoviricetes sp.]